MEHRNAIAPERAGRIRRFQPSPVRNNRRNASASRHQQIPPQRIGGRPEALLHVRELGLHREHGLGRFINPAGAADDEHDQQRHQRFDKRKPRIALPRHRIRGAL
jgi:hypothetical protein